LPVCLALKSIGSTQTAKVPALELKPYLWRHNARKLGT